MDRWLGKSLALLRRELARLGVSLVFRKGNPVKELKKLMKDAGADAVFWNRCYEPFLLERDEVLRLELSQLGVTAESFKAELLVEPWELGGGADEGKGGSAGSGSAVIPDFHSYMRAWMTLPPPPQPLPCPSRLTPVTSPIESLPLSDMGLAVPADRQATMERIWRPGSDHAFVVLEKFLHEVFPAFGEGRCRRDVDGSSRLSPHLKHGELSPRRLYHAVRLRVSRWEQWDTASRDEEVEEDEASPQRRGRSAVGGGGGGASGSGGGGGGGGGGVGGPPSNRRRQGGKRQRTSAAHRHRPPLPSAAAAPVTGTLLQGRPGLSPQGAWRESRSSSSRSRSRCYRSRRTISTISRAAATRGYIAPSLPPPTSADHTYHRLSQTGCGGAHCQRPSRVCCHPFILPPPSPSSPLMGTPQLPSPPLPRPPVDAPIQRAGGECSRYR